MANINSKKGSKAEDRFLLFLFACSIALLLVVIQVTSDRPAAGEYSEDLFYEQIYAEKRIGLMQDVLLLNRSAAE